MSSSRSITQYAQPIRRRAVAALIQTAASAVSVVALSAIPMRSGHAQTSPSTYSALDTAAFALIVEIRIKPDAAASFLPLIKQRIAQARRHPAVTDFRILATDDPLVFRGYESFSSQEAFQAFAADADSAAFLRSLSPLLASPLVAHKLRPLP